MIRAVVSRSLERAHAVDHERRQRDDEQDLAQLGGLEGEERQRRSRAASRGRPSPMRHDEQDRADQDGVEPVLELAQP